MDMNCTVESKLLYLHLKRSFFKRRLSCVFPFVSMRGQVYLPGLIMQFLSEIKLLGQLYRISPLKAADN